MITLQSKGGHPTKDTYRIKELICCALEDELETVSSTLGVLCDTSQICWLPCGYVYGYGPKCPLSCSSVNLTHVCGFFKFVSADTTMPLPQTSTIDVKLCNADLLHLDSGNREVVDTIEGRQKNPKYAWLATPDHPWV